MSTSKEEKIVKFSPRQSDSKISTYNDSNPSKKKKNIIIGISITGVLVAIIVVVLAVLFLINKNKEDHPTDTSVIDDTIKTDSMIEPIDPEEERKLGSEFEFNTKEGDLKRILVKQKYKEDRLIDGEKVTTFSSRITNYDIYIISEKNADEKNKLYYDKLYTCAISIQSECHTDKNEDCTPKTKVDLTNKIDRNDEGQEIYKK